MPAVRSVAGARWQARTVRQSWDGNTCSRRSSGSSSAGRLATSEQEHQRIPKTIALAVFSSDAISSTAYATEEILFVTAVGAVEPRARARRAGADRDRGRVLLAIVATSYRQTIFAYPSGGGSYVVSRENLGENPSLVAGASLLVDYILTVAVSISAGVAAIISIPQFDGLAEHRVELGLALDRCSSRSRTCAASRSRAGCSRSRRTSTSSSLTALVVLGLDEVVLRLVRRHRARSRSTPRRPRRRARPAARSACS